MVLESIRFGRIEVEDSSILKFPQGLPGFPDEKGFVFLPYGDNSPFAFLQSVTEPCLAFLVVQPFAMFGDYQFELDDEVVQRLGLSEQLQPMIICLVTVTDKLEEMTANLLGPVVLNPETMIGEQVILEKTAYTTRHRLFPTGFPQPAAGKEAK